MDELYQKLLTIEGELADLRRKEGYLPVFGEGNESADIVFIGEAPGKTESQKGIPFCGRSGEILNSLLKEIGIERKDVYITNVVKDRPPNNRDPEPAEIALYSPLLDSQLRHIKPKVIVTLGRFAMEYMTSRLDLEKGKITEEAGRPSRAHVSWGEVYFMPLLHPAVALYNGSKRELLEDHFRKLFVLLNSL